MVEGLSGIKTFKGICKGCIVGKHPEHKFDRGNESRASSILVLNHSEIRGPIPTTSMNGSRYVLTFLDDFSRYTWVFFIKQKYEVLEKFVELKALVENSYGRNIKYLSYYNGGNISVRNFYKYFQIVGSRSNIPFPTLLNKMV